MPWEHEQLVKFAAGALVTFSAAADAEQAVRGADALEELELHPLLAAALEARGFGVFRERPYPGPVGRRARHSERDRCDLVLTPGPLLRPVDPMAILRSQDAAAGTLFAGVCADDLPTGCPLGECLWLEVKVVGQYDYREGVPGPNRSYSSQLTSAFAADLAKLRSDAAIEFGAALVVVFSAEQGVAEHDVPIALHRCLDRGLSFGSPVRDGFEITDRIGNRWCSVWCVPITRTAV